MLFNSYAFLLVFLPAAIAIHRIVDPYPELRTWTLVLLSLAFYSYWNPWFVTLLIASILINWLAARWYAATKSGAIVTAAIAGNLAVLGFFKYTNFLLDNLELVTGAPIGHLQVALPLGISFFTFHHIMYLVDLRRGKTGTFPLDRYALYICFFPQAIAGPLARWWQVMDQFGRRAFGPGWERRCALGVVFIVIGLIEKVFLGDQLGDLAGPIFNHAKTAPVTDGSAWFAFAFGFQIFFDFSGYSDIAIGLALIFGIELPQNFNAPFRAKNIQDFWTRWHMTLTFFLRDYLFLRLCDVRFAGKRNVLAAILITMALCGLWHGAGWTFVLWGTLHGCALAFAAVWPRFAPSPGVAVTRTATIGFHFLTSIVFGAGTLTGAWHIYSGFAYLPSLTQVVDAWILGVAALCALLPSSQDLALRLTERPRTAMAGAMALVAAAVLVRLGNGETYEFIYFQF
ncbi:MAG TPA: MBOAT family O-acyltransferase [Xanthobacteraceae bacterium]|nr:MBOAT family O-acyltransferase [Xanthobacteraceae bacterium]